MNKMIRNFCCFGSKYFLPDENRKDDLGRRKKDDNSNKDSLSNKKPECKVKQKLELELEPEKKDIIENCDKKSRLPMNTDANVKVNKNNLSPNFSGRHVDPSQKPSSSCPQLTIEEPTSTTSSNEEANGTGKRSDQVPPSQEVNLVSEEIAESPPRARPNPKQESQKQTYETRSLITKTYSFKRMLSFRGSFRSRDSGGSLSPTNYRRDIDPLCEDAPYRPLQFSFLGQIYAKKSLKKQNRRHSSSLRWPKQSNVMNITSNPMVPEVDSDEQKQQVVVFGIETEEDEEEGIQIK